MLVQRTVGMIDITSSWILRRMDVHGTRIEFEFPCGFRSADGLCQIGARINASGVSLISQNLRPPLRSFFCRRLLDACRHRPYMPGRIHDPRDTISPELVLGWQENLCSTGDRSLDCPIYVLDIPEEHDRRASVWCWRAARQRRPFTFDHEHRRTD